MIYGLTSEEKVCRGLRSGEVLGPFWIEGSGVILTTQPSTIDELKSVVNDFARDMDSSMIRKAESMQVYSC